MGQPFGSASEPVTHRDTNMLAAICSSPQRVAFALLPLLALGCPSPDPKGKFDDFFDETKEEREEFAGMKRDMAAALVDISGTFLFAIEPVPVSTGLYLQFIATTNLEVAPDGSGGTLSIEFQPLSLEQGQNLVPREPIGEVIRVEGVQVSPGGTFTIESLGGEVMVVGEANPLTGSPISADLGLEGFIQSPDLFCGNVFGMVLSPIQASLEGSTFGAVRITETDPASLPTDFTIACPEGGMMGGSGSDDGASTGDATTGG